MPDAKRNIGASVRARLLNLAKQRKQPNDLLLTRYALADALGQAVDRIDVKKLELQPDRFLPPQRRLTGAVAVLGENPAPSS